MDDGNTITGHARESGMRVMLRMQPQIMRSARTRTRVGGDSRWLGACVETAWNVSAAASPS
jgi:hypothetical protein